MYREERDFYEMAVGKPGVVPKHIEQLHEKVSGILHKLSPGRLHVQTLALIAALALLYCDFDVFVSIPINSAISLCLYPSTA